MRHPPPKKESLYTDKLGEALCREISKGGSVRAVCRRMNEEYGLSLKPETVFGWIRVPDEISRPGFDANMQKAMQIGIDMDFDNIMDIADEDNRDIRMVMGKMIPDMARIKRDELRISTITQSLRIRDRARFAERKVHEIDMADNLVERLHAARQRLNTLPPTPPISLRIEPLTLEAAAEYEDSEDMNGE